MTFKPMTVKREDGFIREILEFRRLEFVAGNRKAVNKTKGGEDALPELILLDSLAWTHSLFP